MDEVGVFDAQDKRRAGNRAATHERVKMSAVLDVLRGRVVVGVEGARADAGRSNAGPRVPMQAY